MSKRLLWILFPILIGFIIFANLTFNGPQEQNALMLAPPNSIQYFTMGYTETFGDVLWLGAIQRSDGCEQHRGGSSTDSNGRRMGLDRTPSCHLGWLYHMLSLVLDLIPRFYYAARVGPVILSVIVDDIAGATLLFEKAMVNFPDDWVIMTRAGYHFVFELEDERRGAALYLRAAQLGAPQWMALYAAKLYDRSGRRELARSVLVDFLKSNTIEPVLKKKFEEKLRDL